MIKLSPPKRLRRLPLKGATLVAWQSQFHGVCLHLLSFTLELGVSK